MTTIDDRLSDLERRVANLERTAATYTTADVATELGVTTNAVVGLAIRKGAGQRPATARGEWRFSRADIEVLRSKDPRGRKPKTAH